MMENKVLIKLILPEIEMSFDVFIPVNEVIWKAKKMLLKSASDLSGGNINFKGNYIIINQNTNKIYQSNEIIMDTDIRNGSELILISDTLSTS